MLAATVDRRRPQPRPAAHARNSSSAQQDSTAVGPAGPVPTEHTQAGLRALDADSSAGLPAHSVRAAPLPAGLPRRRPVLACQSLCRLVAEPRGRLHCSWTASPAFPQAFIRTAPRSTWHPLQRSGSGPATATSRSSCSASAGCTGCRSATCADAVQGAWVEFAIERNGIAHLHQHVLHGAWRVNRRQRGGHRDRACLRQVEDR